MSYNASFVSALKEALNGLKTVHTVGEEWVSYVGDIPTGGVPYCGQEVNRSTYSALWAYAQAKGLVKSESEWQSLYASQGGNVAFYSSGNGSSTFRMPRLVGYVRGASSQSESGSYVKEGLPNIIGNLKSLNSSSQYNKLTTNSVASGALYVADAETSAGQIAYSTTSSTGGSLGLDASRSNSIYGNSSHVTPETSVVLYGVYAFGEIGNTSALDASTLASALARVESNIANFDSTIENKLGSITSVVDAWSSGTNWYRVYSDGWIEQGGFVSANGNSTNVTFLKAFSNTNYSLVCGYVSSSSGSSVQHREIAIATSRSATGFACQTSSSSYCVGKSWFACGY